MELNIKDRFKGRYLHVGSIGEKAVWVTYHSHPKGKLIPRFVYDPLATSESSTIRYDEISFLPTIGLSRTNKVDPYIFIRQRMTNAWKQQFKTEAVAANRARDGKLVIVNVQFQTLSSSVQRDIRAALDIAKAPSITRAGLTSTNANVINAGKKRKRDDEQATGSKSHAEPPAMTALAKMKTDEDTKEAALTAYRQAAQETADEAAQARNETSVFRSKIARLEQEQEILATDIQVLENQLKEKRAEHKKLTTAIETVKNFLT